MGTQNICTRIEFADPSTLARELGLLASWRLATGRLAQLQEIWPQLAGSAALPRHLKAWEEWHKDDFERLVNLLRWLQNNRDFRGHIRQLPVYGLDTKWLESRKAIVLALAQALGILAEDAQDLQEALGLTKKPFLVRFRLLCPVMRQACLGLDDMQARLGELARLPIRPEKVLMVENEQTFLALPEMPGVLALFGRGYQAAQLAQNPWFMNADLAAYWGDMDTDGLNMLAMVRGVRRDTLSIMMDWDAFTLHEDLAVVDANAAPALDPLRLEEGELRLLDCLRQLKLKDKGAGCSRLEQERLPWDYCLQQLDRALGKPGQNNF